MGMILQIDDLKLGMFVTVHTGRMVEKRKLENDSSPPLPKISTIEKEDRSFKGRILEIVAKDIPYIVVKEHNAGFFPTDKHSFRYETLDIREIKLMKLTKEYVKVLFPELIK